MEGEDIHGGHGKTGTVHQAPNATIELDEVEVVLLRLNLRWLLLRDIPERENVRLTEVRVVVEAELGVHAIKHINKCFLRLPGEKNIPKNVAVGSLAHRVDLNLGRVLVLEDLVKVDEDISRFALRTLALETKLLRKGKRLLLAETLLKVDGGGDDGTGVFRGDFLDVHTALRGGNKDGATDPTVVQYRDVVLVRGIAALGEHNLNEERA